MQNEYEHRRRRGGGNDALNKLTFLLIGGGIGAILALLFAPKSGEELRQDIADATRKSVDSARDTANQLGSRAGEYYEATRERAGELAQTARDAATRRTGTISAAIEAGKQAYRDEKRKTELSGRTDIAPTYYEDEPQG
ncbi:MAG TPA: YtxH domain-containing protein [Pyrinomonadaceae bacterium]|nr:YtxH domain-containing protein [Pyrinomonadaceae bacterium]